MTKSLRTKSLCTAITLLAGANNVVFADGFPNVTQTPGELLAGPVAPHMGRLAVIEYLGGKVVTIPEKPSSPAGSDFLIRSWDLSDPRNPQELQSFWQTFHPFRAHGTIKSGNEILIGGNPNDALKSNGSQPLQGVEWSGPRGSWESSGMMRPWAARAFWSYNDISGNAWLELDGRRTAEWDHVGQTGVIGFPLFLGNLMIYASDQTNSGVATYDVSDPSNPRLLDVINDGSVDGIGGYWPEIYGHYIVFPGRKPSPRIQVVDFSDPENLKLHCHIPIPYTDSDRPMYANFQDEYAFITKYKVDIEGCEIALEFDNETPVSTSLNQFAMPLGNLVVYGGLGRWDRPGNDAGMSIWAHQAEPDTRGPYVTYHIPRDGQTNYPIQAPISVHIPETLQTETLVPNGNLIVREVGGDNVQFKYVLNHSGVLTIDPIEYLKTDTTYEVVFVEGGILDAANNGMQGHSFRFSTGGNVNGAPTPAPTPAPAPTPTPTPAPGPTPTPAPTPAPTPTPEPTPTPAPVNLPPVITSFVIDTDNTVELGTSVSFTVSAEDPESESLEYRFNLADGNGYSEWSTVTTVSRDFNELGQIRINVQVRDESDNQTLDSVNVTALASINEELEVGNNSFLNSSQLACDVENSSIWAVNPDNDTVSAINANSGELIGEYAVGETPKSSAVSVLGEVWVTNKDSDSVSVLDDTGSIVETIELDYGAAPYGVAMSPDGLTAYVSLYGAGRVLEIDVVGKEVLSTVELGYSAAAIAVSPDGGTLLVTRYISGLNWGEVWQIDTATMSLEGTIRLIKDYGVDNLEGGRGVPNYLAGITFSNDGSRAFVVGTKPNVDRSPVYWAGIEEENDLDDDNTVRTVMATLDMSGTLGRDVYDLRIDFDNADSPSSVTTSKNDDFIFVTLQGNNAVFVYDAIQHGVNGGLATLRGKIPTQNAPQSLCFDHQNDTLFAKNFMSRSITRIDLSSFFAGGTLNPSTSHTGLVSDETLSNEVLRGKQIFYNAGDERMSAEGYISCATCHADGGHDGRTWDFTGRGEGFRNTTSLLGKGGVRFGAAHWSGNFDEIQDFEHDIRSAFLGKGFLTDAQFESANTPLGAPKAGMNDDLDALAAYVSSLGKDSLERSPNRASSGGMTAPALQGQDIFVAQNCHSCHTGDAFTDGKLHDVGTMRNDVGELALSISGSRLGDDLPGLKTPTLLGLHSTAPYFHDGSAKSIEDVFNTVGGSTYQAEDADLSEWRRYEGHIFLRGTFGAALSGSGRNILTFNNVDGGSGGESLLRFRYAGSFSTEHNTLEMTVNDQSFTVELEHLPFLPEESARAGNYAETASLTVGLNEGRSNTITFKMTSGDRETQYVVIDDLSVSTSDDIASADAHTRVMALSDAQKINLVSYLEQLDTSNAPADSAILNIDPTAADQPADPDLPAPTPAPEDPVTPEPNEPPALPEPVETPAPAPTPDASTPDTPQAEQPNTGGLIPSSSAGSGGGSTGIWLIGLLSAGLLLKRKKHLRI